MDDYASVGEIAEKLAKEVDELKGNKIGFISKAREDLAKLWPDAEKQVYISKYRAASDTKWLINGRDEAIPIIMLDHSIQPDENNKLKGVTYNKYLVFIKDAFCILEVRIDWDKRISGSNKEGVFVRKLSDESFLKVVSDDKVFIAFAGKVKKIVKMYSKKTG